LVNVRGERSAAQPATNNIDIVIIMLNRCFITTNIEFS